ncbi:LOW QUALITY PROTEIN: Exostosin, GT47 domain [Dillenia turbinata]|uniref:Exostosin, GT47 domain n=1 Tax=Dillenia turbinata TaxID=194707 RepID=A0AAN8V3R6_9MAGN
MYDLPPEFHFGLMDWKGDEGQTWPDVRNPRCVPPYPGGLNLQYSAEYWLTLDLLSSNMPNVFRSCTVIRVDNSSLADIIFVPFFSSLSYNRHCKIHRKAKVNPNKMLLDIFLMGHEEWKQSGGKNHLIVAHHPKSMWDARKKLGSAMFVLVDFGRYPVERLGQGFDSSLQTFCVDHCTFEERSTLMYFQEAIYRKDAQTAIVAGNVVTKRIDNLHLVTEYYSRNYISIRPYICFECLSLKLFMWTYTWGGVIRQELYYLRKNEKDVHFAFGSIRYNGINKAAQGMASSKFCLKIAGDTPSSNCLFDPIASHCIPVIISDEIELPFEDVLDYSEFCIFI